MENFNVGEYISQFSLLNDAVSEELSKLCYKAYLNKFKIDLTEEDYSSMKIYQENIFDLVENMHDFDSDKIKLVLKFLDKKNPYLADLVIICWSLPRSDNFLSKRMYHAKYLKNISKYNNKLTEIVNFYVIENFCVETLSKTNSVPIHCIDLLWYWMNGLSLEFSFLNNDNTTYLNIDILEDEFIEIGFNMEYLLEMKLGRINYPSDPGSKGTLKDFLKKFINDKEMINSLSKIPTRLNYVRQLKNISKNPSKYFDEEIEILSDDILEELIKN